MRVPGYAIGNPLDYCMLKLRITYCGGCNPEIDRGKVVERLYNLMRAEGLNYCPVPDYEAADVVLIVNGCAHACKEEELSTASFPFISVQGKKLCHVALSEDRLPHDILKKILSLT
jgi:hypothetical protein